MLSLLSACGGGGGGGDAGGGGSPVPIDVAQIDTQLLESSTGDIVSYAADIDDSGRVVTVFSQSNGTRVELKATLATPGAGNAGPTVTPPEVIDAGANFDSTASNYALSMSGNGNAVALWERSAPCTANTYTTSGNCRYIYAARRPAAGVWEAPVLVGDAPLPVTGVVINNAGDVMVAWPGWARSGTDGYTVVTGVAWKPNGQAAFERQLFSSIVLPTSSSVSSGFTLDSAGNMVLVSPSLRNGVAHMVAFRGRQVERFDVTNPEGEQLDTAVANVGFEGIWSGVNGHVVVFWQQLVGTQVKRMAAVLDTPSGDWARTDVGVPQARSMADRAKGVVSDAGNFTWYDLENCTALRRTAGSSSWQASSLSAGVCPASSSFVSAVSRTGDVMGALASATSTGGNTGQWMAYDSATNSFIQPFTADVGEGFLFGVPRPMGGRLLLSENGVGAFITANTYDALPTVANPLGVTGSALNLWAVYVKLL